MGSEMCIRDSHGVPLTVYKNNFFFGQDRFDNLIDELRKDGLKYN